MKYLLNKWYIVALYVLISFRHLPRLYCVCDNYGISEYVTLDE